MQIASASIVGLNKAHNQDGETQISQFVLRVMCVIDACVMCGVC
jgi:hypothetical protein